METLLPFQYLPVLIFIFIAVAFGGVTILAGNFLRPKRPYTEKLLPYESGMNPEKDARQPFPLRYSLTAILFVVFDIEIVFLYPWAVTFNKLGLFALVEMYVFMAVLLVGYFYAWKKGALEWE